MSDDRCVDCDFASCCRFGVDGWLSTTTRPRGLIDIAKCEGCVMLWIEKKSCFLMNTFFVVPSGSGCPTGNHRPINIGLARGPGGQWGAKNCRRDMGLCQAAPHTWSLG